MYFKKKKFTAMNNKYLKISVTLLLIPFVISMSMFMFYSPSGIFSTVSTLDVPHLSQEEEQMFCVSKYLLGYSGLALTILFIYALSTNKE